VIDRNTVTRDWHKAALRDAGLRDMPLHALRHTAAATWLYCGQPLIYVQRALGHASITTTESFYGHLEQSMLETVARDTEAAVRAAGRSA
jgi:integrase